MALLNLSGSHPGVVEASAVAFCTEATAIKREVMRTLSARDKAGALLPGNICADELAYAEAIAYALLRVQSPERLDDVVLVTKRTSEAPLLGYDLVMRSS